VTSARWIRVEVTPSLPVSIGLTMGCLMMPGGGFGLRYGLRLYRAVPPSKTQSQPFPSVTAW